MNLYKGTFYLKPEVSPDEANEILTTYLSGLVFNGQIDDGYYFGTLGNRFHVTVHACGLDAFSFKHHLEDTQNSWENAKPLLTRNPVWTALANDSTTIYSDGNDAPFLYLTHTGKTGECSFGSDDLEPPIRCGHSGHPVPTYLTPLPWMARAELVGWKKSCAVHHIMWMESGTLEMPAYREAVDPESVLSKYGRELCREIEAATGKPTYYYLIHYYRDRKDEKRRCPSCGKKWRTLKPPTEDRFHDFHFKCDPCRLVSHIGVSDSTSGA